MSGHVQNEDILNKTMVVDHLLKSAFHSVQSLRRVHMTYNGESISATVSFGSGEIFLKQQFCDYLFSNGVSYQKDKEGNITLQEHKYFSSFLNALYTATKEFKSELEAMSQSIQQKLSSNSNAFFGNIKTEMSAGNHHLIPSA